MKSVSPKQATQNNACVMLNKQINTPTVVILQQLDKRWNVEWLTK